MKINGFPPSKQLHLKVRAGLLLQGKPLAAWCRENGIDPRNVRHALTGAWDGPKARKLRAKLIEASGIATPPAA